MALKVLILIFLSTITFADVGIRGYILFNSAIVKDAVKNDAITGMSKAVRKLVVERDFEVNFATSSQSGTYYKLSFVAVFKDSDKSKRDTWFSFIKGQRDNPNIMDYNVEIWDGKNTGKVPGRCIPDEIKEVYKK